MVLQQRLGMSPTTTYHKKPHYIMLPRASVYNIIHDWKMDMHQAQDKDQWWHDVNTVMKLWVP
jgi:hypothetical protein